MSDDDQAIAAAVAYFDALNRAMVGRSTAPIENLGTPGCIACKENLEYVQSLAASGRTAVGGQISLRSPSVVFREGGSQVLVRGAGSQTALTVKDPSGNVVESFEAWERPIDVVLTRQDGRWLIQGLSA